MRKKPTKAKAPTLAQLAERIASLERAVTAMQASFFSTALRANEPLATLLREMNVSASCMSDELAALNLAVEELAAGQRQNTERLLNVATWYTWPNAKVYHNQVYSNPGLYDNDIVDPPVAKPAC